MEEIYSETFLKAKPPIKRTILRICLIAIAIIVLLIGVFTMLLLGTSLVFVVMVIVAGIIFFLLPTNNVAYEYIFVDGQIDFDRILGGAKRKTMKRCDMSNIEIVAPENSHKLDSYRRLPLTDYSSGASNDRHYIAVLLDEKGTERIRFTPDEKMIRMMQTKSPSKVATE